MPAPPQWRRRVPGEAGRPPPPVAACPRAPPPRQRADTSPGELLSRATSSARVAAAGFWRGWDGSFHRWLVAYVYRPLLGAKASSARRLAATGVVFAFVALWHDARPKLFVWGLVNCVLVGLERVVGVEARARRVVEIKILTSALGSKLEPAMSLVHLKVRRAVL